MLLCYTALSPFCRKVRMAMDFMGLDYEVFDSGDVKKFPAWNPRAEIPILKDGDMTVRNSATIVEYLHRQFPESPSLLPDDPRAFAVAKEWELIADTMVDPIVTNAALWSFADLPPPPDGMADAARRDIDAVYARLEAALADRDYVAGALSIGDIALYPQIHGAQHTGLEADAAQFPRILDWINRIKSSTIGRADFKEIVAWWKTKDERDVETDKINWGTYRLEWFLAHGFHDWFLGEIERGAVLWSAGPDNNANNSPHAPQ
ncbi:MAG: glutathione S-transferase family protein [Pseudomonadota bacterium]